MSGCADSTLLQLDKDRCRWLRVDPASGMRETILEDEKHCFVHSVAAHPTRPRVLALLASADDIRPVLRELDGEANVLRSTLPNEERTEYAGYDEAGRTTYLARLDGGPPGLAARVFGRILGRAACVPETALVRRLSGFRWVTAQAVPASGCGRAAPLEELEKRVLVPATMPGTRTLFESRPLQEPDLERRLNEAADLVTNWHEIPLPEGGRILRGGAAPTQPDWIAFVDEGGNILGKPEMDAGGKMQLRGRYLLTSSRYDDSGGTRLYDVTNGRPLFEGAESYTMTVFWPCPVR